MNTLFNKLSIIFYLLLSHTHTTGALSINTLGEYHSIAVLGCDSSCLTVSAHLASHGHTVNYVENNPTKINRLINREFSQYGSGLQKELNKNVAAKRLNFSTSLTTDSIFFIPSSNLRHITRAIQLIAPNITTPTTIYVNSPNVEYPVKKILNNHHIKPHLYEIAFIPSYLQQEFAPAPIEYSTNVHNEVSTTETETQPNGNKSLNILFVVTVFPALTETFVLNQITGLIDKGHKVHIYTAYKPQTNTLHPDVLTYKLNQKIYYQNTISSLIKKEKIDIVYCHFGTNALRSLNLIKQHKLTAKLCVVFHGYDMSIILKENPHYYQSMRDLIDYSLPVSIFWKNKLQNLGFDEQKITTHHMGVNPHQFVFQKRTMPEKGPVKFISIARLVEKKGLKFGIQAIAQVAKTYPNIQYNIIGGGPLKTELQKLINDLDANDYIHLLGAQSNVETANLLNQSHIIIAPSVTALNGDQEGIPVSLMEAMAMGLPVISTLHTGIPELVQHNKNGFLAPEMDSVTLAEYITYMLAHPEIWYEMGKAGRKIVEEDFNINVLNNQLEEIFYRLTEKKDLV